MEQRWGLPLIAWPSRLRPNYWDLVALPMVLGVPDAYELPVRARGKRSGSAPPEARSLKRLVFMGDGADDHGAAQAPDCTGSRSSSMVCRPGPAPTALP